MATCKQHATLAELELPPEFQDLEGLVRADLRAIVSMLTERASARLLLTRREHQHLRRTLWDGLVGAVNGALEPLSAENR